MSIIAEIIKNNGYSDKIAKKFEIFADMLKDANKSFNLTRITTDEDMATLHFIDSLAPVKLGLLNKEHSIIDIGTGGGFPAVPLAIVLETHITAVEASGKKAEFVKRVSEKLGLDIEVITARAEELGRKDGREIYDVCVSRAVAPLNVLLELTSPFVKTGGRVICYKGRNCAEEVEIATNAAEKLNLAGPEILNAGAGDTEHVLAVYKKTKPLLAAYPRRFNRIKAAPL